ncbi:MAG: S-adenosylmethionine:tRNA ribosyltransferase-isomerase, partial [Acidimicrobiia bacterium]
MRVEEFRYELPDAAIAQHPVEPRDSARLLDTRDGTDHRFADLAARLEPGDLVVVNTTRVRHARLVG